MRVHRFPENPLLTLSDIPPSREDAEVLGVFNPAAWTENGTTVLIMRVAERPVQVDGYLSTFTLGEHGHLEILRVAIDSPHLVYDDPRFFRYKGQLYLTSISHLRKAVSAQGRCFTTGLNPVLWPQFPEESFGIEDPRLVQIEKTFYLTYCAVSPRGVCTCLATSNDLQRFQKRGIIFPPDNKDVVLFPRQIGGRFAALHRPSASHFAAPSMWVAFSHDTLNWGDHHFVMEPRPDSWDSVRIGCGPHPVFTPEGWIQFYHGANESNRYSSGTVVFDLDQPWKIRRRDSDPFLFPHEDYEIRGFMPHVVFCTGLIERGGDVIDLYYGAADDKICGVSTKMP